jgi:Family of unknown function (DUF5522)
MPVEPQILRAGWRETPHPRRLGANDPRRDEILRRHADAVSRAMPVYLDPTSGLSVFTASFLADRGHCCDSGCRHCPYLVDEPS